MSLEDLVESLKREVSVPGAFATQFPETTDDDLAATLLDAFAQAQLDGFFADHEASDDGQVEPELSRAGGALVVIYAGVRLLSAEVVNRKMHVRYEAGGAVFEQDYAASVLVQALKDLAAKKAGLLEQIKASQRVGTTVVDGYFVRATDFYRGELYGGGRLFADPYGGH